MWVHLDFDPTTQFDDDLRSLGLAEAQHFNALAEASEALQDAEAGLLLICMESCPPPSCEPRYRPGT